MREVKLISGSTLNIGESDFEDSFNLYQSFLANLKDIPLPNGAQVGEVLKTAAFTLISSKDYMWHVNKCMEKSLYNGNRIVKESFQDKKARADYMDVVYEISMENISPFVKGLYAKLTEFTGALETFQA